MNMHNQAGAAAAPIMSERRIGFLGAVMVAIGPISMALYTPAMPEIVRAFGTSEAAIKMTLSAYFAGFAVSQLFCGALSDGLGRRPVTMAFVGLYTISSMLAVVAPTVEVLIFARFLQGCGAAVGLAVSRALVRDLFTHEQSARIMNLMAIILAAGPALAPTIGGLAMELAGWHSIFLVMVAAGFFTLFAVKLWMPETVTRDLSRIKPSGLMRSYGTALRSPYFVATSIVMAGMTGALYAQSTMLPFILMGRIGLTPSQFGVGMLMQSGSFFVGAVMMRYLMRRVSSLRLVPIGLGFVGLGSFLLAYLLNTGAPTFLTVMGPVAFYCFGVAFVMPAVMTASVAPFPHMAGAASSLSGFVQFGAGVLGGSAAAMIGDPVLAMSIIIPALGTMAILAWLIWRRLPEPAQPVLASTLID